MTHKDKPIFNSLLRLGRKHLGRFSQETQFAIETALSVGQAFRDVEIIKDIKTKADGVQNLVTIWDVTSKEVIQAALKARFPRDPLLSEEAETKPVNPLTIPRLWVVDELDGTFNASRGISYYAIAIAFVQKGRPTSGAIYYPPVDELFYGEIGVGAFLDGIQLKVRLGEKLNKAAITTNASYYPEILHRHMELLRATGSPRTHLGGSTVLSLTEVAAGRYDLGFALDAKPWDIAAIVPLVLAAGGVIKSIDGREDLTFLDPDIVVGSKAIVIPFLKSVQPLVEKWQFKSRGESV